MEPFQIAILLFFAGFFHGLCRAFLDVGLEEGFEKGVERGRTDFVFMKESAMRFGAYDMIFEPSFPEEKKKEILENFIDVKIRQSFGIERVDPLLSYSVSS